MSALTTTVLRLVLALSVSRLVDEISGLRFRGEGRRRISLCRPGLDRAALGLPFVEAAVQHRRLFEAERFQHPPEPRRPHCGADRVQHDQAVGADPVAAERGLELRDGRHHETQFGILIGEFALQIEKIRARNMPGLEGVPSGHGDIGNGAAFGLVLEIGRTIEQPEIGMIEDTGEFRRGDKPVALWHLRCLPNAGVRCYGAGYRKKRQPPMTSAL